MDPFLIFLLGVFAAPIVIIVIVFAFAAITGDAEDL